MTNNWEKFYRETPLEKIPWQRTQADYFVELVKLGKIKGKSALDLGCGTGKKSVYLAENGFERVVGVDISKTAIDYAKKNAREAEVEEKIEFIVADATDLSFLKDEKFDFILDWANIHGIPREKHKKYAREIVKHSKGDAVFLLRAFSSPDKKRQKMFTSKRGLDSTISILQKSEVEDLFGSYFSIIEHKTSKPQRDDDLYFNEFLMKKREVSNKYD